MYCTHNPLKFVYTNCQNIKTRINVNNRKTLNMVVKKLSENVFKKYNK